MHLNVSIWSKILSLAVGGALGANARYWLGVWVTSWAGIHWPWATFSINISGAFLLGVLATLLERPMASKPPSPGVEAASLLFAVGLLGGYTTFSTFMVEGLRLWRSVSVVRSVAYLSLSVTLGFMAAGAGVALGRLLLKGTG